MRMTKLDTKEMTLRINDRLVPMTVTISYDYDTDYDSHDLDAETLRKIHIGDLVPLVTKVSARSLGMEGTDYLGGCVVVNAIDLIELANEYDMVSNAKEDLKARLLAIYDAIAPLPEEEDDDKTGT